MILNQLWSHSRILIKHASLVNSDTIACSWGTMASQQNHTPTTKHGLSLRIFYRSSMRLVPPENASSRLQKKSIKTRACIATVN